MKRVFSLLALLVASAALASAWDNHGALTRLSLGNELFASDKVLPESLGEFLAAERAGLPALLSATEAKIAADYPDYPRLPGELAFKAEGDGPELVKAFGRALRVNPRSVFLALPKKAARRAAPTPLVIIDVLAKASDEPGAGMDKGLFTDEATETARSYGFGRMPYGKLCPIATSGDAFDMSFMHEDSLIKLGVPCTRNSLPEARFALYTALSRFAFRQGHPYWGYRFAGWALYYVQELGNPYNASLLPGKSGLEILWIHYVESDKAKERLIAYRANRKALLEDYVYEGLLVRPGDNIDSPLHAALTGRWKGVSKTRYRDGFLDDIVSKAGFDYAGRVDHFIAKNFPREYVADTSYDYRAKNGGAAKTYFPYRELWKTKAKKARVFENYGAEILGSIGSTSRSFLLYVRDPRASAGVRHVPLSLQLSVYLSFIFVATVAFVVISVAGGKNKAKKKKAKK